MFNTGCFETYAISRKTHFEIVREKKLSGKANKIRKICKLFAYFFEKSPKERIKDPQRISENVR